MYRISTVLAVVVCLGAAYYIILRGYLKTQVAAVRSCAASLHTEFQRSGLQGTNIGSEWTLISDTDYDKIAMAALIEKRLDVRPNESLKKRTVIDPWHHRFHVVVRRNTGGNNEFVVWSTGPDGKSGTPDDITYPWGANVTAWSQLSTRDGLPQ